MRTLLFIVILLLTACGDQSIQPTTPLNTSILMKSHIDNQNYDFFQSLFAEGYQDSISKETFDEFTEFSTSGANYKNYELITFNNGEMLLVEFKPALDNEDELKIVNVTRIPEEAKYLFDSED